jgi:glycosyltransferase involved in cell wall biosynthesis
MLTRQITVAIDARLPDQGQGGVLQVLISLSNSLNHVPQDNLKKIWIVFEGTNWWNQIISEDDEIFEVSAPFKGLSLSLFSRFPKLLSRIYPLISRFIPKRASLDNYLNSREVDLVHLPYQDGLFTNLPFVYNPHDLQHFYFPDFFSKSQIKHRNRVWRAKCKTASLVFSASPMVTSDLTKYWEIPQNKIFLVPIPPPRRFANEISDPTRFPSEFFLYPAVSWPHKNHKKLLQAWAILKNKGYAIPLVLTGAETSYTQELYQLVDELGLNELVFFHGHVSNNELTWLLAKAKVVIVPSLFEAMSLTVWDAQFLQTPVMCSNVDPFPLQVADTAIMFDPHDPLDIANQVMMLWDQPNLQADLILKANQRIEHLTEQNYGLAMYGAYLTILEMERSEEINSAVDKLRHLVTG